MMNTIRVRVNVEPIRVRVTKGGTVKLNPMRVRVSHNEHD